MNFLIDHDGQDTHITLVGSRFDASVAPEFKTTIGETIAGGANSIALNMGNVEFIDSSALGAIISIYKVLNESGQLTLFNLNEDVKSVFKLTKLDHVFDLNQISTNVNKQSAA